MTIPNEAERPEDCGHPDCLCLVSRGGRLCVGRLPEKKKHDDLFNTHRLCDEDGEYDINFADATFLTELMMAVRKDVLQNGLWHDDQGMDRDFVMLRGRPVISKGGK